MFVPVSALMPPTTSGHRRRCDMNELWDQAPEKAYGGFQITGRVVLLSLLAFFAMIFAVNGVMIYAATSTFGGLEIENAYKAGLAFNNDIAAAHRQDDLQWDVNGHITRGQNGTQLEVSLRDAAGAAVAGIALSARLAHPTD